MDTLDIHFSKPAFLHACFLFLNVHSTIKINHSWVEKRLFWRKPPVWPDRYNQGKAITWGDLLAQCFLFVHTLQVKDTESCNVITQHITLELSFY